MQSSSETGHQPTTDPAEAARLGRLFEHLRERLLDMRLSNPMLNYRHRPTSKSQLQIVDEVPEEIYRRLTADGASVDMAPLPEPEGLPADEDTEEFRAELEHAKVADVDYLTEIEALEATARADDHALAEAETRLRVRLRERLGLPPRPSRRTINPVEHARALGIDPSIELEAAAQKPDHGDRRLQTLKWPDTLDAVLERIADNAHLAEQEMGVSTLFLVFGFLEWAEPANPAKRLFAPLLLLPVRLDVRKSARGRVVYALSAAAEGAETNLSLEKKLLTDYGIVLPAFSPEETAAGPIEDFFTAVSDAVEGQPGHWRVRRFVTLGHFAFGRLAMYADLQPENWARHPALEPLVGAILRGTEIAGDGGVGLAAPPDDHDVDAPGAEAIAPYLVLDADASQHSAVIDVMSGRNLVIQGPPGTGKSQTIANVIANALAAGKTVLFLAEKMAALEVVKRRLDEADLGDFCLEVHSDKATPRKIIDSLKHRHRRGYDTTSGTTPADVTWSEARQSITAYVDALHAEREIGRPFDQFWRAVRARGALGDLVASFRGAGLADDVLATAAGFERARGLLDRHAAERAGFEASFGPIDRSDWSALRYPADANPGLAYGLADAIGSLAGQLGALVAALDEAPPFPLASAGAIDAAARLDAALPTEAPGDDWLAALAPFPAEAARRFAALVADTDARADAIVVPPGFDPADADMRACLHSVLAALPDDRRADRPGESYDGARAAIAAAERMLAAAKSARDAAFDLGFAGSLPASGLACLYLLGHALTQVPAALHDWLATGAASIDELTRAAARLTRLCANDAGWRGRFPAVTGAWPAPDALEAAGSERRKSGLSRLFADGKLIESVNQALGLPPRMRLDAEDYEALADHSRALASALADRSHPRLFEAHWRGLDTPVDTLLAARRRIDEAIAAIRGVAGGNTVAEAFAAGGGAFAARLVAALPQLQPHVLLSREERALIGRSRLDELDATIGAVRAEAEDLLALDPDARLQPVGANWDELALLLDALERREEAEATLAAAPMAPLLDRLRRDPAGATTALDWLERLAGFEIDPIVAGLMRPGAAPLRHALRERIAFARPLLAAARAAIAAIAADHGVTGLDIGDFRALAELTASLSGRRDELSQLLGVRAGRAEAAAAGLGRFLAEAEARAVPAAELPLLFTGLVAQQRAERLRRSDRTLSRVTAGSIEGHRREFRKRDRARIERDRRAVLGSVIGRKALAGSNYGSRRTWTEGAFLNNEFGKERALRPLRELMRQAGRSVQALKPCFMMSPLSLAKFLPANDLAFDLLVIDEASQMRPEDALGGMLRARQVVVVGDPKQLPPTDFFQRTVVQAEEDGLDEDDTDDESILEACHKTFRQLRLLKWHYRSRCESLIAFSNREIYAPEGRQLITFPAPAPGAFSIDRIRVRGAFEARRNAPEAQRIAEEALRFMHRHAEEAEPPTLGLVAMNGEQADLIQEELRLRWTGDDAAELYRRKVAERGEPLFVKNLENVQGDERDYILISLTYGPKNGDSAVMQRFGPVARKQGDRRLNVLFTRARRRIGLVTSMDSSDVRPSDTSSRGVHLLKKYLAYVESAGQAAAEMTDREPDSDFEIHVADRLEARGFTIRHQVGVSGYRIDLAVADPARPEHFLAGIECDGAQYHSSRSARDRDRLRQEVLEGLGWTILRVWSTDWFDNPERKANELAAELGRLAEQPRLSAIRYAFDRSPPPASGGDAGETAAPPEAQDDLFTAVMEADAAPEPIPAREETAAVSNGHLPGNVPPAEPPLHEPWTAPRLSPVEARAALAAFRDQVIMPAIAGWEPERSLLRAGLIETFVEQRVVDEDDWFQRVPQYQRRNTSGPEKQRFFADVCDIVARIDG